MLKRLIKMKGFFSFYFCNVCVRPTVENTCDDIYIVGHENSIAPGKIKIKFAKISK